MKRMLAFVCAFSLANISYATAQDPPFSRPELQGMFAFLKHASQQGKYNAVNMANPAGVSADSIYNNTGCQYLNMLDVLTQVGREDTEDLLTVLPFQIIFEGCDKAGPWSFDVTSALATSRDPWRIRLMFDFLGGRTKLLALIEIEPMRGVEEFVCKVWLNDVLKDSALLDSDFMGKLFEQGAEAILDAWTAFQDTKSCTDVAQQIEQFVGSPSGFFPPRQ